MNLQSRWKKLQRSYNYKEEGNMSSCGSCKNRKNAPENTEQQTKQEKKPVIRKK